MKLYKMGEKSKAICSFCNRLRSTTFKERDVPLSAGKGIVPNVLVAVCDACDRVVSVPQQSVPRIREAVRFSRHSIEARVPRHLLDAIALSCQELGFGPNEAATLFRYYVQRVFQDRRLRARLAGLAASPEAQGRASARFSAKLSDELYDLFRKLERESGLNKADLVKGIIVQMKVDLLDHRRRDLREDLRQILRLAA